MRRLLLLRHAKTERAETGERDRDRKLTKRGRNDAPVIGAYMANHGLVPDLALVSPATRAQETWALIAPCFAKAPRMVTDDRIYNAGTAPARRAHRRDHAQQNRCSWSVTIRAFTSSRCIWLPRAT